jgi:uncharacterized protein with FMN-binding domain
LPSPFLRNVSPAALIALGVAVAGCGHQKVQRSDKPAAVTVPQTTTSTGTTTTAAPKRKSNGTVVGPDVNTKFGDVQVSLTLKNGRIADVQWVKIPLDRPRSRDISQTAAPILRSEVLAAQSGKINLVSGATYTSDAWASSVQSALLRTH